VGLGVDTVFGLLGDGNLDVVDELVHRHGVRYVPVNREDLAVSAADGYSRSSGRLGVAAVTHGPGLTNAITPLHEAARSRTPLLVLCGDTDPDDPAHNQDIDQQATVAPTGAGFVEIRSPDTVCQDLARAVEEAMTSRRPVVFNLPAHLQSADTDCEEVVVQYPTPHAQPVDQAVLDEALGVLASASRPAILVGRGATGAEARHHILMLAELLRAPVATTLRACGLFAGEPFNLGVCGTVGSPLTTRVLDEADCLIVFGAGLNRYTTSYGSLLIDKSVVQVDTEPDAIGRWYPVERGVIGDSALVAGEMTAALSSLDERPRGLVSDSLADSIAGYDPTGEYVDSSSENWIDPRTLMIWLDRIVPPDRAFVCDVGGFMENPLRYLSVNEPRSHVLPAAFGSVGLSMGTAIGAGLGREDRPVLVVMGDGGWMMGGINGLDTAVHLGLDMVIVVLNDGGYGIEHRALAAKGSDPSIASMAWPQPSQVATALGSASVQIGSLADLDRAAAAIAARTGPLVIDARIPA